MVPALQTEHFCQKGTGLVDVPRSVQAENKPSWSIEVQLNHHQLQSLEERVAALAAVQRGGAHACSCPHTKPQCSADGFATDAVAARCFRLHLLCSILKLLLNLFSRPVTSGPAIVKAQP